MSFTGSRPCGSSYRRDISQIITGEGEREKEQRKLKLECSSPPIPVSDSELRLFPSRAIAGVPITNEST